jgi:hypothetical protein
MDKSIQKISPDKGILLKNLFQSFTNGLNSFKAQIPQDFLKNLGLDQTKIQVGFNSGQWHHRKDDAWRQPFVEHGLLSPSDALVNDPKLKAYTPFGNYSLVFPLKNERGEITNLYAKRIKSKTIDSEYLNEEGVYPHFPHLSTKRLFVSQNVIDGATILQAGILDKKEEVIALRDGAWSNELYELILSLADLQEIVLIGSNDFDETRFPKNVKVTKVELESSVNELWLMYGPTGMNDYLNELILKVQEENAPKKAELEQVFDDDYSFQGREVTYRILGLIPTNPSILEMQFEISAPGIDKHRVRLNLLDTQQIKDEIFRFTDDKDLNYAQIILELNEITEQLQLIRANKKQEGKANLRGFSSKQDKLAKQILSSKNLFSELNKVIGETGVVGEERSRLLLFMIASSYKFKYNLHAIIQTDNKNSGDEFVTKIAELIPETERYFLDLTNSRTFRYYGNSVIDGKLLVIPDYAGITYSKAINDLKKLQAKGFMATDTPVKGTDGKLNTIRTEILGHTSSIGACLNSKKFFQNEPRTILIGMDTSQEQSQKMMDRDCLLMAGMVDFEKENQAKELLQYVVRNIYPLEVVNPFASALMLPITVPNARLLTLQLSHFVNLVALFSQHQRSKDKLGRVIAQKEDIQFAVDLFFESIMLNLDELDSTTRKFFEKLKAYILTKPEKENAEVTTPEVVEAFNSSSSNVNRFFNTLLNHEFIQKEGFKNKGYKVKVINWKDNNSVAELIKAKLSDSGESKTLGH